MIPKLMERLEGQMRQKVGEEATIEVIDLKEWSGLFAGLATAFALLGICSCVLCAVVVWRRRRNAKMLSSSQVFIVDKSVPQ